jgi:beta-glucosidase
MKTRFQFLSFLIFCTFIFVAVFSFRSVTNSADSSRKPASNEKFLWGAASAAFQTEGSPADSDWNRWHRQKWHTKDGTTADKAADFWNLYHEDILLAKNMGANSYRLSIAWERIEPQKGVWDEAALEHYEKILTDMQANGIEPLVTLQHFTLPVWLSQEGGVLAKDFVSEFTAYAKKVVTRLSASPAHVSYWMSFNEPYSMIQGAYMTGWWPPEKNSGLEGGFEAEAHFSLAHIEAVRAIRELHRPWIKMGIAQAWPALLPKDPNDNDSVLTTRFAQWFVTRYIIETMMSGDSHFDTSFHLPDLKADAQLAALIAKLNADPQFAKKVDLPDGKPTLDFVGINFYTRDYVIPISQAPFFKEIEGKDHHNKEGWEISPEFIGQSIHEAAKYGVPVIITENGTIDPNIDDQERIDFLKSHIEKVWEARKTDPVIGYMYWSMTDNFEWECGLRCRFGLVAIDYNTLKRTPRQSYYAYKKLISEHQE